MRMTILVVIMVLGVTIPLLWVMGTLTSIIYFIRHRERSAHRERGFALGPQLGLTMADGGDPLKEKGKE